MQIILYNINSYVPYISTVLNYRENAQRFRESSGGNEVFHFEKELKFKNISFAYKKGKNVIDNLSFNIKKGEFVGLVGTSGAGKTTLFDLLLRLLTPGSGEITLDGKDVTQIDMKEWRRHIEYVPQEIFMIGKKALSRAGL